jgi:hypothetical protein
LANSSFFAAFVVISYGLIILVGELIAKESWEETTDTPLEP